MQSKIPEILNWFSKISVMNTKTLKGSEIKAFMAFTLDVCHDNDLEEPYFYFDLKVAIEYELNEEFGDAIERYKNVYEQIKSNETSNYTLNSAKKIFEPKISKMLYCYAELDYKNKDYDNAIRYFKEAINDEYMTNDIKIDCKVKLVFSLNYQGDIEIKDEWYEWHKSASEKFEEALSIINSDWKVKNKIWDSILNNLKNGLVKCYIKFATISWSSYDINSMEKSINYLNKARSLNGKSVYDYLYVYYYLYKAKNEFNDSYKSDYIYQAQKYAPRIKDYIFRLHRDDYTVVDELYYKSRDIIDLKNQINSKNYEISNLNYELNCIINDINNTQSIINNKKILIKNKNDVINSLVDMVNSSLIKGKEINNKTDETIKEEKDNLNKVEKNIKDNKDFMQEIKEFEKQKNEDIKNFKNNNKILEQKNQQLMLMLTSLESKF